MAPLGPSTSRRGRLNGAKSRSLGKPAYLIDSAEEIRVDWFAGKDTVLITAGASAPEPAIEKSAALQRRVFAAVRAGGGLTDLRAQLKQEGLAQIQALPAEQRKAYLLQPQAVLTLQGMVERILQADGITREQLKGKRRTASVAAAEWSRASRAWRCARPSTTPAASAASPQPSAWRVFVTPMDPKYTART